MRLERQVLKINRKTVLKAISLSGLEMISRPAPVIILNYLMVLSNHFRGKIWISTRRLQARPSVVWFEQSGLRSP